MPVRAEAREACPEVDPPRVTDRRRAGVAGLFPLSPQHDRDGLTAPPPQPPQLLPRRHWRLIAVGEFGGDLDERAGVGLVVVKKGARLIISSAQLLGSELVTSTYCSGSTS